MFICGCVDKGGRHFHVARLAYFHYSEHREHGEINKICHCEEPVGQRRVPARVSNLLITNVFLLRGDCSPALAPGASVGQTNTALDSKSRAFCSQHRPLSEKPWANNEGRLASITGAIVVQEHTVDGEAVLRPVGGYHNLSPICQKCIL